MNQVTAYSLAVYHYHMYTKVYLIRLNIHSLMENLDILQTWNGHVHSEAKTDVALVGWFIHHIKEILENVPFSCFVETNRILYLILIILNVVKYVLKLIILSKMRSYQII